MAKLSDKISLDNLHFVHDPDAENNSIISVPLNKNCENLRNLEDYFSFLEDIAAINKTGREEDVMRNIPFTL